MRQRTPTFWHELVEFLLKWRSSNEVISALKPYQTDQDAFRVGVETPEGKKIVGDLEPNRLPDAVRFRVVRAGYSVLIAQFFRGRLWKSRPWRPERKIENGIRYFRLVPKSSGSDWIRDAKDIVRNLAAKQQFLTADDFWARIQSKHEEPRAFGAIFPAVAREGLIRRTGRFQNSTRTECNHRPMRVWESMIYPPKDDYA